MGYHLTIERMARPKSLGEYLGVKMIGCPKSLLKKIEWK